MDTDVLEYSKSQGISSLSVKDPATAKTALTKMHNLLNRLQDARASMWGSSAACKKLASPHPKSDCGWKAMADANGQQHSLERSDLYCETIEWQYTEMGAGDDYMKQCPGAKKVYRSEKEQAEWQEKQKAILNKDGVAARSRPAELGDSGPSFVTLRRRAGRAYHTRTERALSDGPR